MSTYSLAHVGLATILVGSLSFGFIVAPKSASQTSIVVLGQELFRSVALSADRTTSCQSCHDPSHAFADARPRSIGVGGARGTRNAPSLVGVANDPNFFWDGRRTKLEEATLDPFTNPAEFGWHSLEEAMQRLHEEPRLAERFRVAFPGEPEEITPSQVQRALTAYVASLPIDNSAFDHAKSSGVSLPLEAEQGRKLFEGVAECSSCHTSTGALARFSDNEFHHSGIGNISQSERLPQLVQVVTHENPSPTMLGPKVLTDADWSSLGRFVVSRQPADIGAFRTPSLRNVAVTAPYMHDGSIPTLAQAVDHEIYYRSFSSGRPINLTLSERQAIVVFLETLTDEDYQAKVDHRGKNSLQR